MLELPAFNELLSVAPYLGVILITFYTFWVLIEKIIDKTFKNSREQAILVAETVSKSVVESIIRVFQERQDKHEERMERRHDEIIEEIRRR